jgi:putative effector of murein hydrolase LrgA (UPF0299 family)
MTWWWGPACVVFLSTICCVYALFLFGHYIVCTSVDSGISSLKVYRFLTHNHYVFSHWSACAKPGKWLSCMYVCMLRVSILPQFLLFFLFVFGTAPTVWLFVLFCYFVTLLVLLFVSWLCRVVEAFTQHNTPQRLWYSSALLFIIPTKTDHIAQLNTNVLNLQ